MGLKEEILAEEAKEELMQKPNVLNVRGDRTKIVNGVDTEEPTITVIVGEKVDDAFLLATDRIPKKIVNVRSKLEATTDVVVLKPTTWTAGKTTPSRKPIREQKKLASGLKLE